MSHHFKAVKVIQEQLSPFINPGDRVIDATCGNGRDTAFLAKRVGPEGKVFAFDIQKMALEIAHHYLFSNALLKRVELVHAGHEEMSRYIPFSFHGKITAVIFNLGYLPGGDKSITTLPASTLPALDESLKLLKSGGCIGLVAYRGHSGGKEEEQSLLNWLQQKSDFKQISWQRWSNPEDRDGIGPVVYLAVKTIA